VDLHGAANDTGLCGGDALPGFADRLHQLLALVEDGLVAAQVGLRQAQTNVGVEAVEVVRQLAAALQVECGLQALVDDAQRTGEGLRLGLDVTLADGVTASKKPSSRSLTNWWGDAPLMLVSTPTWR
jgi:hypothetical protein